MKRSNKPTVVMPYSGEWSSMNSFLLEDAKILSGDFEVIPLDFNRVFSFKWIGAVVSSDIVYTWFTGIRFFPQVFLAYILGKKIVCNIGGYEAANRPDISYGSARGALRRNMTKLMLSLATEVLTVSLFSRNEIKQNLSQKFDAKVITNCISDVIVEHSRNSVTRPKNTVTIVASTQDDKGRKGFDIIVEICRLLPDFAFSIVGVVDEASDTTKKLRQLPNVKLAGKLSHGEMIEVYDQSRFYLQTSRYESFGVSVIEAAARGATPIVSSCGALPEVAMDERLVVENSESAQAYVTLIKKIFASESVQFKTDISQFRHDVRSRKIRSIFADLV